MDASELVPDVAQVSGPTFCEAFPMWGFPCVGRRRYAEWGRWRYAFRDPMVRALCPWYWLHAHI